MTLCLKEQLGELASASFLSVVCVASSDESHCDKGRLLDLLRAHW